MTSLRFVGAWQPSFVVAAAVLCSLIAFWLYRRRLSQADVGSAAWMLPTIRALAIFLLVLTFAEPTFESKIREGQLAKVTFLIDASRSMTVIDAGALQDRFARAVHTLRRKDGILQALQDQFEVEVRRFDDRPATLLWSSALSAPNPIEDAAQVWQPQSWSDHSALGDALVEVVASDSADRNQTVVLLSDGQNNSGASPVEIAAELAQRELTVFAIGFGPGSEPFDLALREVNVPERLVRSDTLHGTAYVIQTEAEGQTFSLQVEHDEEIVWHQDFIATMDRQRSIDFTISVADLYERVIAKLPPQAQYANLPIKLSARLIVADGEASALNNAQACYFEIAAQKSRLLLLDGRSRWESRYLNNMFARDPAWTVDAELQLSSPHHFEFPRSKEELFQYDLILLGDIAGNSVPADFPGWIREFVELAGGGLIVIDGARQNLRDPQFEPILGLLPVAWIDATTNARPAIRDAFAKFPQLSPSGRNLDALQLSTNDPNASLQRWSSLPGIEYVSKTEALPGSEVLIEAVNRIDRLPLLVTRRYGAGRVLFAASDETWRWRYQTADGIHSRIWLQLARWVMKPPMDLTSEFVSLDTSATTAAPGQPIELRCQLRRSDGQPSVGNQPTAVISSGGLVVARIPLAEESIAGNYSAQTASLPRGDYRLQIAAPGFSADSLDVHTDFSVIAPPSEEMQRIACNHDLLKAISEKTGGKTLLESEADQLTELLQPLRRGKIRVATIVLWQSYWWFSVVMLLLISEWILRKKVGLV